MKRRYTHFIKHAELQEELDSSDLRIIDLRWYPFDPDKARIEFDDGHIPGAIFANLDLDLSGEIIPGKTGRHPLPDIDQLISVFQSWGIKDEDQVVVYDQLHGGIAARLWWLLRWMGHDHVAILMGGFKRWREEGLAVSTEPVRPIPGNFNPSVNGDWVIMAGEVETSLGHLNLIDCRAENRYQGIEEPIDPVAGHIPTAVNRPFLDNLDSEFNIKSKETLKKEWNTILDERADSAVYCGSGVTACFNFLIMDYLNMPLPKIFIGSWSEWITDSSRPIAST